MASRLILSVAKRLVMSSEVETSLAANLDDRDYSMIMRDSSTPLGMTERGALEYGQQPPDEARNAVEVFKKK
jgi:hypothetical protein